MIIIYLFFIIYIGLSLITDAYQIGDYDYFGTYFVI